MWLKQFSIRHLQSTDSPLNVRRQMLRVVGNRLFIFLFVALIFIPCWVAFVVSSDNSKHFSSVPTVIFTGVVGGIIGLQNRRVTLDDSDLLLLANSTMYVLLAPLVGGFLALLLLYSIYL